MYAENYGATFAQFSHSTFSHESSTKLKQQCEVLFASLKLPQHLLQTRRCLLFSSSLVLSVKVKFVFYCCWHLQTINLCIFEQGLRMLHKQCNLGNLRKICLKTQFLLYDTFFVWLLGDVERKTTECFELVESSK